MIFVILDKTETKENRTNGSAVSVFPVCPKAKRLATNSSVVSVPYSVRYSKRSKTIRITIKGGSRVVVSAPLGTSKRTIGMFVREKDRWITHHITSRTYITLPSDKASFLKYQEKASALVLERIRFFNTLEQCTIQKIGIKNHKSQWGSCSSGKNIYINYRVIFLPQYLADYVIMHELCHLREMNHSRRFWDLLKEYVPNFRAREKDLKQYVF